MRLAALRWRFHPPGDLNITWAAKCALSASKCQRLAFYEMSEPGIPGQNCPERVFNNLAHSERFDGVHGHLRGIELDF